MFRLNNKMWMLQFDHTLQDQPLLQYKLATIFQQYQTPKSFCFSKKETCTSFKHLLTEFAKTIFAYFNWNTCYLPNTCTCITRLFLQYLARFVFIQILQQLKQMKKGNYHVMPQRNYWVFYRKHHSTTQYTPQYNT